MSDAPLAAPAPNSRRQRVMALLQLHDLDGERGRLLRRTVFERGALTPGYALMCLLSAGIAMLGLLQSSTAVVIGAMLVSPLMTPIAALGFAIATFDAARLRSAIGVVAVGAIIGIATGVAVTWLSPIDDITPEILARTEPTLLDLAVALLSGLAGGYAIVRQQGETAIGVAIATALMPPLATVGYGIAALRPDITGGALLLFFTNLAAIAIAIATVARLTGAAAPRAGQHLGPGVVIASALIAAALLTPLALTLVRLQREIEARRTTVSVLTTTLGVPASDITKLDVSWPLRGAPAIAAIVITPSFQPDAPEKARAALARRLDATPQLDLQQIEIGSGVARSEAAIAAALARSAAPARDDPPFADARAALPLPVSALWHDAGARIIYAQLIAAPGWGLADYRRLETTTTADFGSWRLRVVPPPQAVIDMNGTDVETAIWALKGWGLHNVTLRLPADTPDPGIAAALTAAGIAVRSEAGDAKLIAPELSVLPPPLPPPAPAPDDIAAAETPATG